jgi:hypothetical protein
MTSSFPKLKSGSLRRETINITTYNRQSRYANGTLEFGIKEKLMSGAEKIRKSNALL